MLEMLTAGKSGPAPSQKWYTGNELIAYDSYNFNPAGFTDYTGKPMSTGKVILNVTGELPNKFNDNSFQYGGGIRLGSSASIFLGSSRMAPTTLAAAWTLDFWVRCDVASTEASTVGFLNGFYLFFYQNFYSPSPNNDSRLLIGPNVNFNGNISLWNNTSNPRYNASNFDAELKGTSWVHFAITYNGSGTTRFYVNGQLRRSAAFTLLAPTAAIEFGITGYQQRGTQKMVIERYRFRSGNYFPANGFDVNTIYDVSQPYAPGPTTLAKGDSSLGYYGEVSSADMIKGTDLAQYVGLGSSNILYDTGNWLCYSLNGKRVYVAKKPIMNQVSWNTLNAQGLVTGSNIVVIHGIKYKVRLLTGVNSTAGEWNSLIYRVHVSDPTGSNWASFTNEDLVIGTGSGRTTWCQEDVSGAKVYRGYNSLTDYQTGQPTSATDTTGWRPILEPV